MNIKLHLDTAESAPIERLAEAIGVKPEDVAYAALNILMMNARDVATQHDIINCAKSRSNNLPLWADSAGSIHAYEGMHDCDPQPSKYSI